jgi:hypothetical protein
MVTAIGQVCCCTSCDFGKWMNGLLMLLLPFGELGRNSNRLLSSGYLGPRAALSWPSDPFLALLYWNRMSNESNGLWHTKPAMLNHPSPPKKKTWGGEGLFHLIRCFDRQECTSRFPRSNERWVLGNLETAYNLSVISLCQNRSSWY